MVNNIDKELNVCAIDYIAIGWTKRGKTNRKIMSNDHDVANNDEISTFARISHSIFLKWIEQRLKFKKKNKLMIKKLYRLCTLDDTPSKFPIHRRPYCFNLQRFGMLIRAMHFRLELRRYLLSKHLLYWKDIDLKPQTGLSTIVSKSC